MAKRKFVGMFPWGTPIITDDEPSVSYYSSRRKHKGSAEVEPEKLSVLEKLILAPLYLLLFWGVFWGIWGVLRIVDVVVSGGVITNWVLKNFGFIFKLLGMHCS